MAVIVPAEKGIGVETRGKIGKTGEPDPRSVLGIYRVRRRWGKVIHERLPFYTPTNPQTVPQQANRQKLTDAVAGWQGLTNNQKEIYNERARYKPFSGYNLYIGEYILSN